MFSPNQVGGGDQQSESFSGRVFIEKKASPNEWQILVVDAKAVPFFLVSGENLAHGGRVRVLARYGLGS